MAPPTRFEEDCLGEVASEKNFERPVSLVRVSQEKERKGVLGADNLLYLYVSCVPFGT